MTDIVDKATRSRMMSKIRSKDTKPEIMVRKALHARGFRFRLHPSGLPCRPDMVLPKHGVAIFVHGCFWHRHPGCIYTTTPATRTDFWEAKFARNRERDEENSEALAALGWRIFIVWECGLKDDFERLLDELAAAILNDSGTLVEFPTEPRTDNCV